MEDSFRVRADRAFGSLSSSSSPSSQSLSSSLWCLTDDEIEKREWRRQTDDEDEDDDNHRASPSNVDQFFAAKGKLVTVNENLNPRDYLKELEGDLQELEDDAGEGTRERGPELSSLNSFDEEEGSDVKNSIGMDCSLDYEEEEDEYDKVAVGSEKTGDRLHLCDITDYVSHVNSYKELPNTFEEAVKDPRANHMAAKLRLKEDEEQARSFNTLQVSDQTAGIASDARKKDSMDGNKLKSILKRKEDEMDLKSKKRVRFDTSCRNNDDRECKGDKNVASETFSGENILNEEASFVQQDSSMVPDYIRNPSKYTYYTFDSSSDMDEESNSRAYMDFLNMLRKSKKSDPDEAPADLSKPVLFNPKKKAGDASMVMASNETDHTSEITMEGAIKRKSLPLSIAAGSGQEDESCGMEVDEPVTFSIKVSDGKRAARQYRSKQNPESDESNT